MCRPHIDTALECAESHTVLSIDNGRLAAPHCSSDDNNNPRANYNNTAATANVKMSDSATHNTSGSNHNNNNNNKTTCQHSTPSSTHQQQTRFRQWQNSCKTKSYVFLLVILSAILVQTSYATPVTLSGKRLVLHTSEYRERYHQELLQKERARIQPTPHRHHMHLRSVADITNNMNGNYNNQNNVQENDNGGDPGFCEKVVEALQRTQRQANATYQTLSNHLEDFARSQYVNTTKNVYRLWQKHDLRLKHPLRDLLVREYDTMPDIQKFAHIQNEPLSKAMIARELQNAYQTLAILDHVLNEVIKNRKENKEQLCHEYGRERCNAINNYFEVANRHVNIELKETKEAMTKLNIPVPELSEPITYNQTTSAKEWLVVIEHVSVIQYLRQLYNVLLSKCPAVVQ